ncbi:aminotransferase, partial [Streptomyces benahoarensis]
FAEACERAGVVVRPFAGEGVRVTIGESAAMDLFLGVAEEFRKTV